MFRKNNDSGSKSDRRIVFNASNNKSRPTKLNDRFKEIEENRKARQSSDRFSVVMKRRTGQRPKVSLMQEFNSKNKSIRRKRSGASIRDSISKRLGSGKNVPISARLGNIDIKKRLNMKTASNRNGRNQRNRRSNSIRGGRGRGRGGRNGGSKRPLDKNALDKELDNYMFQNKDVAQSNLDAELDVYMKDRNDGKNSPSADKKDDSQTQAMEQ
ncbi:hypothetical protein LY90DRAFT_519672 [Neocallimastix californiae]|jgi:hypothetical protein|uniref:Chromatin target of PRMT1 protein C-terminal domain-containing protein n=1 Tax=Neocallimastix californiae TaxID=1754190 RepID=A0A1Y1YWY4_9FUNG|nr:hypothetical protein LY90DRAFT_519672 [Neocallimastix californiae]|eukprot:ORY02075.1 hypothetical protein LY90DRAFT_519672 [Neocallimastix californiae]